MIHRDPALASLPVIEAFESLGIPYYITGSVASTHLGVARSTMDVDLVADVNPSHISALVNALQDSFYIDGDMIREAVEQQSSFNVVHLGTMIKVDVFIPEPSPEQITALHRARRDDVFAPESDRKVYVASPEDVILSKLKWYKTTGERSDRQWTDVQGVLRAQANSLDSSYLADSAEKQGLSELLRRAIEESET